MSEPVVLLDTNALMQPVEADTDTFAELERLLGATTPVVPRAVRAELDRLAETGAPAEAAAARVGRKLATERCRSIGRDADGADGEIERLARTGEIDYVVTNDRTLRNRLLDASIPVISLRGKAQMEIIRP